MNQPAIRISAIDTLRALTMVLMIFVNDLWSLTGIPGWLEHTAAAEDGMGLADTVFPAFLFIVGMSIPFAIRNRQQKGDSPFQIKVHIVERSLALLVMGVFLVNGEYLDAANTGFSRGAWNALACTSFILIWNQYPKQWNKTLVTVLKLCGTLVLLGLVYKYRGGEGGQITLFNTWWWGILGLIGWGYLVAALLYAFANGNRVALWAGWLISMALCMFHHSGLEPQHHFLRPVLGPIGDGAMPAFTIGGAIASSYFWQFRQHPNFNFSKMAQYFVLAAAILLAIGFLTRPIWGISKIRATPSWVLICSAITLVAFVLIYWITDLRHHTHWTKLIRPAGTDTLLCYLIPYYAYALVQSLVHWTLPEALLTGGVGLLKSLVFALLVTTFAGLLARRGIKLKL